MEKNNRLGIILGIIGAVLNIVGVFIVFMRNYESAQVMEFAEPGCEMLLKWIMPGLADVSIVAGVMFALAAYGFFCKKSWAFPIIVIAVILALQGSWFVSVPFMAGGEPPIYFIIFWPNLILYFFIMKSVGKLSWGVTVLGMFAGMSFVLCFMNGIASSSRIITIGTPLFVFVQRLNFVSSIGWGIVTAGILIRPRDWMRVLGIASAFLQLMVGAPLAIETTIELGRFSLFSIAPIISLVLFILLLSPARFQWMTGAEDEEKTAISGKVAAAV